MPVPFSYFLHLHETLLRRVIWGFCNRRSPLAASMSSVNTDLPDNFSVILLYV